MSAAPAAEGRRLRIYSDRGLLPRGIDHVTILCAFWGRQPQLSSWPDYADELIEHGNDFLEESSLDDADVAVFPRDLMRVIPESDDHEQIERFRAIAHGAGKPAVFFYRTDLVEPLGLDGDFVFRTALHRNIRAPREFALPGFHEDLLARWHRGEAEIRRRTRRATIGFCGGVTRRRELDSTVARARRALGETRYAVDAALGRPDERDLYIRARALDALDGQGDVDLNVLLRDAPAGGAWSGHASTFDRGLWERVRREYVINMLESDYVLCARGAGNWSYRLTEALSLGRIPVYVDTEGVLPYDFAVDWREYVVWIDRTEVDEIGERVAAFHEQLTDAEFTELQRECRRLWKEKLSPLGFFRNFHRHFEL